MNRKAIREDGMPGGRNKNIGPVQLSMEEIESVLTGREFNDETAIFNSEIRSIGGLSQNGGNNSGNNQNNQPPSLLQNFDLAKSMQTASQSMARFTQGISTSTNNLPTLTAQQPLNNQNAHR